MLVSSASLAALEVRGGQEFDSFRTEEGRAAMPRRVYSSLILKTGQKATLRGFILG